MLVYVVTVATSAFFVPHYLSVFWEPLRTNPWDIVGGAIVIVVLVGLNIVGVQEAAKLSIVLAVIDFATQVLLVILGFLLVFSPTILVDNVHWGVAPTWSNLAIAVPVAMLAYTGVETVSNLAEEAREPARSVPNAYKLVAAAVFAIYLTLPLIALSALPVKDDRRAADDAARTAAGGGRVRQRSDPRRRRQPRHLGLAAARARDLRRRARRHDPVHRHERRRHRRLARHVLDGELPADPGGLPAPPPDVQDPVLSLVIFAGIAPILILLPGDVNFVGTLYSFGATLSFTVAHVSLVRLRMKQKDSTETIYRAKPNLVFAGSTGRCSRSSAGIATGASFLVILVQNPTTRWVGLGWIISGLAFYIVYRRAT